jgi:peptidoglycan/xylan/chitin deacetylase (PgdA/CDA1 family)
MYHQVVAERGQDPLRLGITRDELRRQFEWLRSRRYTVASLRDAISGAVAGTLPRRAVALTFDDGYMDFYTNAMPLLQEFKYPATAFLVSSLIGQSNVWDRGATADVPLMGAAEIREVRRLGVEIGSHSCTHRRLGRIEPEQAREEVESSKKAIEDLTGEPVPVFCYPYGSASPAVEEFVAGAGYEAALGIEQRRNVTGNLSRIDAVPLGGAGLRWRYHVSGTYFRARRVAGAVRDLLRV